MQLRPLQSSDFETISPVLDEWWGGRAIRHLLPRLLFEHFGSTSYALVEEQEIRAFLVGFQSRTNPSVAYIHFVGVAPTHLGKGYGRALYSRFFEDVASLGCAEVHCITSPVNAQSIAFHRHMGFSIVSANGCQDGVPVTLNHAGEGQHRVLFCREVSKNDARI